MIHYKVKARLAINLGTDDFRLQEFEQVFTDEENPIEARKQAYSYYVSLLDVLGANALKASTIMTSLYTTLANYFKEKGDLSFVIPESYPEDLGIGLYFFSNNEGSLSKEEDYFIMGLNDFGGYHEEIKNLELEKRIYDLNNWDIQNWITKIKYYDLDKHTLSTIYVEDPNAVIFSEVLWCPTDFWDADNPLGWLEDDFRGEEEKVEDEKIERPIESQKGEESFLSRIIKQGENRKLEFKSTLRYCLETNKPQEYVEHSITKTITALANSEGGLLLIGVNNDGNLLGLDNDINSFRSKSQDGFLKHFDNLIRDHFSEPIDALLNYGFEVVQSQVIFMINVEKSNKPRFLITKKRGKEFYIRRSASTNSLDIEEATQYIIDKWYATD